MLLLLYAGQLISNSAGAPGGRTGAPGELTCQEGCHNSFALNTGPGTTSLSSTVPETGYEPGQTYQVSLKIKNAGVTRFGFGATTIGTVSQTGAGNKTLTEATRTKLATLSGKEYITHTSTGTTSTDSATWSFNWTAPAAGTGEVKVYASFVGCNVANNGRLGDHVYTQSLEIKEAGTASLDQLPFVRNWKTYTSDQSIYLEIEATSPTALMVEVLGLSGNVVYRKEVRVSPGVYTEIIPAQHWGKGLYFLRLGSGLDQSLQKLIL
jgi:hypothetical protein